MRPAQASELRVQHHLLASDRVLQPDATRAAYAPSRRRLCVAVAPRTRPDLRRFAHAGLATCVRRAVHRLTSAVTFALGPFINDALNEALSQELEINCADIHKLCSACESYTHEREADAVGLRCVTDSLRRR